MLTTCEYGHGATLADVPAADQQPVDVRPPDPPMVPVALGGMAVWLVALVVSVPLRSTHESWFWICVAGFLWGVPGLLTMIRYDAGRRARRRQA